MSADQVRMKVDRPGRGWSQWRFTAASQAAATWMVLVVLPGVMSDAAAWSAFASALRSWSDVWVVNRRGRHPSGPMQHPHTLYQEVDDLASVLDAAPIDADVFGWSYGALIALTLAKDRPMPLLIAYEPVIEPFGIHALTALHAAHAAQDWDEMVAIVNRDISGFSQDYVDRLRGDEAAWSALRTLAPHLPTRLPR